MNKWFRSIPKNFRSLRTAIVFSFRKFPELILSLTVAFVIIAILLISLQQNNLISGFLSNIAASIIFLIFTIIFIDYYFEKKKEEEWKLLRNVIMKDVNFLITRIISAYIVFFGEVTFSLGEFKQEEFIIEQAKKFKTIVYPKLKNGHKPEFILSYQILYTNIDKIYFDLTYIIDSYIERMDSHITASLILLKSNLNFLREELRELDSKENSNAKYENIRIHSYFVVENLKSLSENIRLYSGEPENSIYKLD